MLREKVNDLEKAARLRHGVIPKLTKELEELKAPYIEAILKKTPKHLYKAQMYGLQHIFFSDGWFILYCLKELVNNGKLKLPTEEQRKSLTTLIAPNV